MDPVTSLTEKASDRLIEQGGLGIALLLVLVAFVASVRFFSREIKERDEKIEKVNESQRSMATAVVGRDLKLEAAVQQVTEALRALADELRRLSDRVNK